MGSRPPEKGFAAKPLKAYIIKLFPSKMGKDVNGPRPGRLVLF
jgi:hypothetical protein